MTSILTNNGAIVALQTLKMTNMALEKTQNHISTGRYVNKASDGSATWAIAKTMETDRDSFGTISRGLNNAATVVGVAEDKAAGIKDDLNEIKQLLLNASNPDNDVTLNWKEVEQWIKNIESKINQAQFNGVNLLNKDGTGNGVNQPYRVIGSLDRAYGITQTSQTEITVDSSDFQTKILDVLNSWQAPTNAREAQRLISGTVAPTFEQYAADQVEYNDTTNPPSDERKAALEEKYTVGNVVGAEVLTAAHADVTAYDPVYAAAFDGAEAVPGTKPAFDDYSAAYKEYNDTADVPTDARKAELVALYGNDSLTAAVELTSAQYAASTTVPDLPDTPAVTASATSPENSIEALIKIAIDESARLGSAKARIISQNKSVDDLKDALTQGIGVLVDADLEEASARLQALQAQQQLGIQALSIANQAPQSVLSLFR